MSDTKNEFEIDGHPREVMCMNWLLWRLGMTRQRLLHYLKMGDFEVFSFKVFKLCSVNKVLRGQVNDWVNSVDGNVDQAIQGRLAKRRSEKRKQRNTHQLYRHWDADDNLLYIGISISAIWRLSEHKSKSAWYPEVAKITIENYPDRDSVVIAEKQAIQDENPKHNSNHKKSLT